MDTSDIQTWISIGTGLIAIGTFIYAFLTRGSQQNAERLDKFDGALTALTAKNVDLEHRVDKYRAQMLAFPSKDDFNDMSLNVERMAGDVKGLNQLMGSVSNKVDTMENYLIYGKGNGK